MTSAIDTLRNAGLRATPARVAVLEFLNHQDVPVGIQKIKSAVPRKDIVTVYRIMDHFQKNGLVRAHDIGHGHMDYELADRPHHHHVVCESCGTIEDINCEDNDDLNQTALSRSKNFNAVREHQTTFAGICNACIM